MRGERGENKNILYGWGNEAKYKYIARVGRGGRTTKIDCVGGGEGK